MWSNKNFEYANYGLKESKRIYSYGGLNRVDVFKAHSKDPEYQLQLSLRNEINTLNNADLIDDEKKAELTMQLNGGHCEDLAWLTARLIMAKYPEAKIYRVFLDDHHLLLLKNDIDNAVVLDPWSGEAYLLAEFFKKQAKKEIIPYFTEFSTSYSVDDLTTGKTPYLSGKFGMWPTPYSKDDLKIGKIPFVVNKMNKEKCTLIQDTEEKGLITCLSKSNFG